MLPIPVQTKTQNEARIFPLDFGDETSGTIASVTSITSTDQNLIPSSTNLTVSDTLWTGTVVNALYAGGTLGELYLIDVIAVDSLGQTLEKQFYVSNEDTTAIVVEDGTGKTNSNSYVSVANATLALQNSPYRDAWEALGLPEQQAVLAQATFYLDDRFRWYGQVMTSAQALMWPRTKNYDRLGNLLTPGTMPPDLIRATCMIAGSIANDPTILAEVVETSGIVKSWASNGLSVGIDPTLGDGALSPGMKGSGVLLSVRFVSVELLLRSLGVLKDVEFLEINRKTEVQGPPL